MSVLNKIQSFSDFRILVMGDSMIDAYYIGKIERMSPEAPVPIVSFNKKDHRPGGAANVALNLKSLGAQTSLCSVVGNDAEGLELSNLLKRAEIDVSGIFYDDKRPTTVKTRVIASDEHLLRMDHESIRPIDLNVEEKIIHFVSSKLNEIDLIIFEDYNKGMLTQSVIQKVITLANENNIETVVDPKKDNFLSYRECTFFKPNRKEIIEGLPTSLDLSNFGNLEKASTELMDKLSCQYIMVTLSEDGVFIKSKTENQHVKAHKRNITDVSGAGDTVVSVAALCLAAGCGLTEIAEISNLAGGLVCQKVGVVPITQKELIEEIESLGL